LRWCNEDDLLKGKGIKICGNSNCERDEDLNPYEVSMNYIEQGDNKSALVKVYLCTMCGEKLNKMYKYLKKKRKRTHNGRKKDDKPEKSDYKVKKSKKSKKSK
jgi:protein FRA10AC1